MQNNYKYFDVQNGEIKKIKKVSFKPGNSAAEYNKNLFATTKEFLAEALSLADKDKNSALSITEFKSGLGPMGTIMDNDKLTSIDFNKNGNIETSELAAMLKWMDKNKDGTLDKGTSIASRLLFTSDKSYTKEVTKFFNEFKN